MPTRRNSKDYKITCPKVGHLLKFKSELEKITPEAIPDIKDKTKLAIY